MPYQILVTDDNSEYRANVIELLQFEGFDVIEASNGKEAIEQTHTHKPDLILCDVDMPIMDGFAVLAELKADAGTRNIPFFLVTGRADAEAQRLWSTLGADDYMLKPINIDVLLLKIRQHLGSKSNKQTNQPAEGREQE